MADMSLNLSIYNNTSDTFNLQSCSGISQPQMTLNPGDTTAPPCNATSDFQIKGHVTYLNANDSGKSFTVNFYMPVIGGNSFSVDDVPGETYDGSFSDESGWNLSTTATITAT
ncbi:MAG: hypothetical protein Q7U06_00150 [Pseudomonadota bacterium]|nr:hypothetical protein [Pseudomonadota bacterium]